MPTPSETSLIPRGLGACVGLGAILLAGVVLFVVCLALATQAIRDNHLSFNPDRYICQHTADCPA